MASSWDFGSGDEMYDTEDSNDEVDEKGSLGQGNASDQGVVSHFSGQAVNGSSNSSVPSPLPPASCKPVVTPWRGPTLWCNTMFSAARFPVPANASLGCAMGSALPITRTQSPLQAMVDEECNAPTYTPPLLTGDGWDCSVEEKDDGWEEQDDPATSDVGPQWHELLMFEGRLANLKKVWVENNNEAKEPVKALIREVLEVCINPYQFLVYMVAHSGHGGPKGKHCLPRAVLLEFREWKGKLTPAQLEEKEVRLLQSHQVEVLQTMGAVFPHYIDDLCSAFELKDAPQDDRLRVIEEALTAAQYKDATLYAVRLGMKGCMDMQRLLLPLVALDKINVIESYLYGDMPLQRTFVTLVDQICSKGTEYITLLNRGLLLEGVVGSQANSKVTLRQLEKLSKRLIKQYSLPLEDFPYTAALNARKSLHFILVQRYRLKTVSDANLDELLKAAVDGRQVNEQALVVTELMHYNDLQAASRLARYCQLPDSLVPASLKLYMEENTHESFDVEVQGSSPTVDYHQLNLELDCVHWVDDEQTLDRCQEHITMPGQVVGIDAEWRMPACNLGIERMALLQLATKKAIFLLDPLQLVRCVSEDTLRLFLTNLIANNAVLKIGYGMDGDMCMLAKTWGFAMDVIGSPKRILDLQMFVREVEKVVPGFGKQKSSAAVADTTSSDPLMNMEEEGEEEEEEGQPVLAVSPKGLSLLVQRCLGRPLDKTQQLSDWERRPLRKEQVLYAALDAFCLLELYDYLSALALAVNPKFDVTPTTPSTQKSASAVLEEDKMAAMRQAHENAKGLPLSTNPPRKVGAPIRPRDLHVVADFMFQGLGKQLRLCGVNSKVLNNDASSYELIKISIRENRIVLTSGKAFYWTRNHVPEHLCYFVTMKKPMDQVKEVLEYYNVRVTAEDIMSRCQICNGDQYVALTAEDFASVQAIAEGRPRSSKSAPPGAGTTNGPSGRDRYRANQVAVGAGLEVKDGEVCISNTGIRVQTETVPRNKLIEVDEFYVCQDCGKVYWEGGHFDRTLKRYQQLLTS